MREAIEEESVVIEQGKAIALNRSTEGMLLCMRQAPHVMQMIEVRIPCYRWRRTATVFDVRWVRSVHVESFSTCTSWDAGGGGGRIRPPIEETNPWLEGSFAL